MFRNGVKFIDSFCCLRVVIYVRMIYLNLILKNLHEKS